MNENELDETIEENPDADLMAAEGLTETEETPEEVVPKELELIQVRSILESVLLASDKPLGTSFFKEIFKGTNIKTPQIREALETLTVEYTGAERGLVLIEVGGGYQLRTKGENSIFVRRMMKGRPFRLSGPALEVLAIIAYKQPIIKSEVDDIRGVESGHLMRALMDRGLIRFDGKAELPGKPMLYATTRKFLEIFGLKDLRELPSLADIDQLIPEGIGDEAEEKDEKLGDMQAMGLQYQADPGREQEWEKITEEIAGINTSSDFFEKEKERERQKRDLERAEDIREKLALSEEVDAKDLKWLAKYEAKTAPAASAEAAPEAAVAPTDGIPTETPIESDIVPLESVVTEGVGSGEPETVTAENASRLGEILEGLKSKNASQEVDAAPSDREPLKTSVYRPDQLAQALKDFETDDE
ncbi:MAG: SMC-Scp complex subunit ScpB [Bdellovibrionia bacterium]